MNRWAARIIGLLMLLIFGLVFVQLHKSLVAIQRQHTAPAQSR